MNGSAPGIPYPLESPVLKRSLEKAGVSNGVPFGGYHGYPPGRGTHDPLELLVCFLGLTGRPWKSHDSEPAHGTRSEGGRRALWMTVKWILGYSIPRAQWIMVAGLKPAHIHRDEILPTGRNRWLVTCLPIGKFSKG